MSLFEKTTVDQLVCSTWFERDRQHVRLETPNGRVIFELWDEDVSQAIEDGYLKAPLVPRPSDKDWHASAVDYAKDKGLLEPDGSLPQPKPAESKPRRARP
ncbi:hypothetical protein ABIC83_002565 [Roseateles asaccharophilus]|uniref:hypothetical protein n=1 Tax=Roseateles asaccharophilus TaxID=582607 RepID=UPI0038374F4A